jgi:hypothetical protein
MAELQALPVVMALSGGILIYCSVKNKKPLDVMKLALSGKDPNTAPPISGSGTSGTAAPPIDNRGLCRGAQSDTRQPRTSPLPH